MIPVLIVHYRNEEALKSCWASAVVAGGEPICWDNSEDNLGLTKAFNRLAKLVKPCEYIVWLNQDAIVNPFSLGHAKLFMDEHPDCAIAGFKQLSPDDPDFITHGGTTRAWPGGIHLSGRVSEGHCRVSRPMLWVNMAAAIIRVSALKDIGLQDERYFLYFSDSDWCLNAWLKGWQVWYCAEAVVVHGSSGCAMKPTEEQKMIIETDQQAFANKWGPVLANNPICQPGVASSKLASWSALADGSIHAAGPEPA